MENGSCGLPPRLLLVLSISATALAATLNLWEVIRRKTRNLALGRLISLLEYLALRKVKLFQPGPSIFREGVFTITWKATVSFLGTSAASQGGFDRNW